MKEPIKYFIKNRGVFLLPWIATSRKPWDADYERVIIPYTPTEKANSKGWAHIQIVHRSNLETKA